MIRARRFAHGFTAPWRALRFLLEHPELWPLAAVPAVFTSLMLALGMWFAFVNGSDLALWLAPGLTHRPTLLWLLRLLTIGALAMVYGMIAYLVASLLSLPFLDRLSERTEELQGVPPCALSAWESLPVSVLHSLGGLLLFTALQILLMPLQLVPGIGSLLDFVFGGLLSAFFLAHQMSDGPLSRREFSFREKLEHLWTSLPTTLGIGFATMALLALPLLNLLGLPICVVAGAQLVSESVKPEVRS